MQIAKQKPFARSHKRIPKVKKYPDKLSIKLHRAKQGKFSVESLVPLKTQKDLSLAYTPGVAAVSRLIAEDRKKARVLTMNGRTIAIISDGSAVLGLGNIGPEAALPVMEGKAVLFKKLGGLDAVPLVLKTQDVDEIVKAVQIIAPTFAGINLEDISAPRCFEIERKLIETLDIPVMHDDQHGAAVAILAGLINALFSVGKKLSRITVVVNGAGAAATATVKLLIKAGVNPKRIIILDSLGILYRNRGKLIPYKAELARITNGKKTQGNLETALKNADVFIGLSKGNVLNPEWIKQMAEKPIIFALANPQPEINYSAAKKTKAAIIATGRSDFPNQINNALVFPGIFKGTINARAKKITDTMKLAAARAIAQIVPRQAVKRGIIAPSVLNPKVASAVAKAVSHAARHANRANRNLDAIKK